VAISCTSFAFLEDESRRIGAEFSPNKYWAIVGPVPINNRVKAWDLRQLPTDW